MRFFNMSDGCETDMIHPAAPSAIDFEDRCERMIREQGREAYIHFLRGQALDCPSPNYDSYRFAAIQSKLETEGILGEVQALRNLLDINYYGTTALLGQDLKDK